MNHLFVLWWWCCQNLHTNDGGRNFHRKYRWHCDINGWTSQHRRKNYVTVDLQAEHSPVRPPTLDLSSTSTVCSTSSVSEGKGPQLPHCLSIWAAKAGQLGSPSMSQTSTLGLAGGVTSQLPSCTSGPLHCDSSKLPTHLILHSSSWATVLSSSGQASSHSNHQLSG
jgi:hypothetical protein